MKIQVFWTMTLSLVEIPCSGAFAKLRKATTSFVMAGCPSARRIKQLGSHWTDFHEI
jgi:hypothetical protein